MTTDDAAVDLRRRRRTTDHEGRAIERFFDNNNAQQLRQQLVRSATDAANGGAPAACDGVRSVPNKCGDADESPCLTEAPESYDESKHMNAASENSAADYEVQQQVLHHESVLDYEDGGGASSDDTLREGFDDVATTRYLDLVASSVTGTLDCTCRADGWRNNTQEFGLGEIPNTARTQVGHARLKNIRSCIKRVCNHDIPGDYVELGCWAGGSVIYAKACLDVYGHATTATRVNSLSTDNNDLSSTNETTISPSKYQRAVWCADCFSGIVQPKYSIMVHALCYILNFIKPLLWPLIPMYFKQLGLSFILKKHFPGETLSEDTVEIIGSFPVTLMDCKSSFAHQPKCSLEDVTEAFARHNLLDENVKFLKGWFSDTLPTAPIGAISILRLDGDFYESTMTGLQELYHKISPGGYCIIDDYNAFSECKRAVTEFREQHHITAPIHEIDFEGVYWRVPLNSIRPTGAQT